MREDFTSDELNALLICVFHMFLTLKAEDEKPAKIYHTILHKLIRHYKRSKTQ